VDQVAVFYPSLKLTLLYGRQAIAFLGVLAYCLVNLRRGSSATPGSGRIVGGYGGDVMAIRCEAFPRPARLTGRPARRSGHRPSPARTPRAVG
jgi:hypothetical protein